MCVRIIIASTPIMEQSPKNVTVLDGKDATIVCRAVGAPQPNITWHMGPADGGWAVNGEFFFAIDNIFISRFIVIPIEFFLL